MISPRLFHSVQCRTFERQGCIAVFRGHGALVTRVAWRPPLQNETGVVFLSAALDETVRIWHVDRKAAQSVLKNPQVIASGCQTVEDGEGAPPGRTGLKRDAVRSINYSRLIYHTLDI